MPCSLCKKTGHNRTTCQRKYSTDSLVVNHSKSHQEIDRVSSYESAQSCLNNVDKYPKAKSKTPNVQPNEKSNKIWNTGKSDKIAINRMPSVVNREAVTNSSQSVINTVKYPKNVSKRTNEAANIGKTDIRVSNREPSGVKREVIADENKNVISIKEEITRSTNKKTNSANNRKSHTSSSLLPPDLILTKTCTKDTEITETKSANKSVTKHWKDIKIEDGDKDILCYSAMGRFFEGPTKDEGDGYIYMYTYESDSIIAVKQQSTFKIGMTKNLPDRRIQVLGHDNHEKYVKVHSEKVSWRRLAENLIHKQLTANGHHCPRKDVKGGTEWFKGSRDEILNVIHLVIRFLNVYALPLQQNNL
ncbi:uncharacterized protein LOC119070095 [Bradysia coprophila]|uniref:uncharacterized protein LOC119070095 n=1 Tax=Bradysia coprophila TaxID=38358 RepID=UPI00187DA42F|nr:uncharacterized protein LOC119070095 [Bradysia coprophila]